MAAPDGPSADHLTFLRRLASTVERYGLFPILRGAEARAPNLPRIGRARTPSQNVVDLAQSATMDFPAATISALEATSRGRVRVRSQFLGLTGAMGALPLHLTEYAAYERRYGASQPFGRFLDVLTDRLLQFFYRAWADSQPASHADRPVDDRFSAYVGALTGARDGAAPGSAFAAEWRLLYAGVFAGRRSAAALQDAISHLLGVGVVVREFMPRWRAVAAADRSHIGASGAFHQLGRGAMLGSRVRLADDAFRVEIIAETMAEYESLMPGGARFALASEALSAFAPSHLEWEIEAHIDERRVVGAELGCGARLGWTSWLAPQGRSLMRTDARLTVESATASPAVGVEFRGMGDG